MGIACIVFVRINHSLKTPGEDVRPAPSKGFGFYRHTCVKPTFSSETDKTAFITLRVPLTSRFGDSVEFWRLCQLEDQLEDPLISTGCGKWVVMKMAPGNEPPFTRALTLQDVSYHGTRFAQVFMETRLLPGDQYGSA